jgi:UDP-3-O-[3-hydroxymyristoyl] glucosamine N-acyltransferase
VIITVDELAALVGGRVATAEGGDEKITGVAGITEARQGQVTFYSNRRYLRALKSCQASAALVPEDFDDTIPPIPVKVANPSLAFARIIEKFASPPIQHTPGVHPTAIIADDADLGENISVQPYAVVESGASIGSGTIVGAHCYIGHGVTIGASCKFYPNVTIRERCVIGNRVIIHSGAVLGSDGFGFETINGQQVKIPQTGIVQLEDDVEIGANTTIDRARFGRTLIGEGTKIDNLVQIAHNVVIGRHCVVVAQCGISGSSRLGNHVTLAGQVGLVGHIDVGDGAIVTAKSGVSKDVPAREVLFGIPACPIKKAKERIAALNLLPKLYERVRKLEQVSR